MNVNDSLGLLTQLFFILLGFITTLNYFRYRGKTRRDIALMSCSLAIPFLIQIFERTTDIESPWWNLLGSFAFLTQPYLLLRLAHYFHNIPSLVMRLAFIAMITSGVAIAWFDVFLPGFAVIVTLAVLAYFVAVDGYAMIIFVRGALLTSGVVQQRMRLAATGSGLLALTLLAAGLMLAIPAWQDKFISLALVSAIASALSYTIGFAPPHWLRRAWQLSELRNYLLQISHKRIGERLNFDESLSELCQVTNRATSGSIAAIAQEDTTAKRWVIRHSTGQSELINHSLDNDGLMGQIQDDRAPTFIDASQRLSAGDRHLLEIANVDTLLVTPIATAEYNWGFLLVFLKRSSLFIEDDLSIITLLAQQSALFLENGVLIEEMRHYSEGLEQRVEERTSEIRHLNMQLERRVAERTADLSHANAELGKVLRAKDEFLANMSHELRTPLNGILILAEVLLEQIRGPLNQRQIESLQVIQTSGQHLLSLINDILDLSKIEAGKLELQAETISVNEICQVGLRFVKELAHQKQLRLIFSSDNQDVQMQVDPRRLKQILINLLSNAVKFTPNGGQVDLKMLSDEEHNVIRFIVEDTGIGISAQDMTRLFKPFTQLDAGLTREHDGTGLGLALVSRLVELHGGSIAVESAGPGQGSRFTVSLPWQQVSEMSEDLEFEPSLAINLRQTLHRLIPGGSGALKSLVVEDSSTAAEQIDRYLKELGVEVVAHSSGERAVETVLATAPHLIILDLLMPDQSGWDVLAQLKADPRTRAIPVIIISVVDEPSRGLAAGAIEYLVKPISRERLKHALVRVVTTLEKPQPTPVVASTVGQLTQPEAQSHLLLLVEDNETNIVVLGDYLQTIGYRLVIAHNGSEAIERALETKPDLILMDMQMPVMDGLTATQRMRAISELATTPIIALTALAMPGDRERCLAAGANEYLSKPVSLKGLRQIITQLLAG